LILCPEIYPNVEQAREEDEDYGTISNSGRQLLQNLRKYAHVRSVSGQIKGSIVLTDNSRVLSISEEGIDALAIYSDNKSLVNNFGSLFETLWIQREVLNELVQSKDALLKSNEKLRLHDSIQKVFINIAAHELRTPVQPLLIIAEHIRKDLGNNEKVTISKKERRFSYVVSRDLSG
jgi:signal transduction histidine kinase